MTKITIDATNLIAGRLGSYAAKQALLGHEINILNSEHAIITGNPAGVRDSWWLTAKDLGQPQKGPFVSHLPDRFLRRIIRGMLPRRHARGRDAYRKIMCYIGVPTDLAKEPRTALQHRTRTSKVQTIGRICTSLGWKA